MNDPLQMSIAQRLAFATVDFINRPIVGNAPLETARLVVAGLVKKQRDENGPITPEADRQKKLRLILDVRDEGRTKAYTAIRNLRLELTIQGNSQVPAGSADACTAACGAMEKLLDESNLFAALDSPVRLVRVMLAVRPTGFSFTTDGNIRKQTYSIDLKAIRAELTTDYQS